MDPVPAQQKNGAGVRAAPAIGEIDSRRKKQQVDHENNPQPNNKTLFEEQQAAENTTPNVHGNEKKQAEGTIRSTILRPHPAPLMVLTTNLGKSLPISFRCWDRMYLEVPPATNNV